MSRGGDQRLQDITESVAAIDRHLQRGPMTDPLVRDAIRVRLIEIGEAVKRLPTILLDREPEIPWPEMATMLDHLAHRYFDASASLLLTTVQHDLPELVAAVDRLRGYLRDHSG